MYLLEQMTLHLISDSSQIHLENILKQFDMVNLLYFFHFHVLLSLPVDSSVLIENPQMTSEYFFSFIHVQALCFGGRLQMQSNLICFVVTLWMTFLTIHSIIFLVILQMIFLKHTQIIYQKSTSMIYLKLALTIFLKTAQITYRKHSLVIFLNDYQMLFDLT